MFADCLILFRQVPVRHRTRDGRRSYTAAELQPVYVVEDPALARELRDALEDECGMPAHIGRARLWKEDGHGEG